MTDSRTGQGGTVSKAPTGQAKRTAQWAVVLGVCLTALSLRGPIVATTPILKSISDGIGLSTAVVGTLMSLPLIFFALATPLGSAVIRKAGPEAAIVTCLIGVSIGTLVRSAGAASTVVIGTVIIGAAIAIGNVAVPVIIRADVSRGRIPAATGIYTAALNIGSMVTSLGVAPLAAIFGWQVALASWGMVAAAGTIFWLVLTRGTFRAGATSDDTPTPSPVANRDAKRITWLLTFAFGGQAFAYYTVTTWLPGMLADLRGLSPTESGAVASLFQISAIGGAVLIPLLSIRGPIWLPMAFVGLVWTCLPVGMLVYPDLYPLWAICGGIGQGGGFTAIFSIVARSATSETGAASMSARVQAGGYLIATLGPPTGGALHALTGGWNAVLFTVAAASIALSAFGHLAVTSRANKTEDRTPASVAPDPREADRRP